MLCLENIPLEIVGVCCLVKERHLHVSAYHLLCKSSPVVTDVDILVLTVTNRPLLTIPPPPPPPSPPLPLSLSD